MADTILQIEPLNGAESEFALAQIGVISFRNDTAYLFANNGDLLGKSCVLDIRKVVFVDKDTAIDDVNHNTLRVFPNPTADYLEVCGVRDGDCVRIFSPDGRLMLTQPVQGESVSVPVSQLSSGTWLLQINMSVIKFIKQ